MVTTRKASGGRAAAPTSKQSTLSFNHRVTKAVPKSAKEAAIEAPASKKVDTTPAKPSPLSKSAKPEEEEKEEIVSKVEVEVEEPEKEEQEEAAPVPEKSEAEVDAEKITDAQINKYWRGVEAERIAKRVHQEDLDTSEKVLRYFDVSSQYGPCIGITRTRRWMRANKLGLNPPIEVLAVLLKEEAKGRKGVQTAQMDSIMNSTAITS